MTTDVILDNFNRANENPLSGVGNWSLNTNEKSTALRLVSNRVEVPFEGASYWTTPVASDFFIFFELATFADDTGNLNFGVYKTPTTPSSLKSGYIITVQRSAGQFYLNVDRYINNALTAVIGFWSPVLAVGDAIGLQRVGSTISMWVRQSGAWVQYAVTGSAGSFLEPLYLGLAIKNTAGWRIDNVGQRIEGPIPPSVGFDAVGMAASTPNVSSRTFPHTNAGNLLLVSVGTGHANAGLTTVTSVTYNGVPLIKLDLAGWVNTSRSGNLEFWFLASPPLGTYNIIVTWAAAQTCALAASTSFKDANVAAPFRAMNKATGLNTAASAVAVPSEVNDMVFAAVLSEGNTTTPFVPGAGQAVRFDIHESLAQGWRIGGSTKAGASPTATITNEWAGGGGYATIGVSIQPAPPFVPPTDANDPRKIGRLVTIRTATGRLRPARITAVGAGSTVTAVVQTHGQTPVETYTVGQWSRSTPGTPGWIRT